MDRKGVCPFFSLSLIHSSRMKIYHLTLLFFVLANGLLSVIGARLKCPSVSIANGVFKIRSKGRIIVYKCNRGYYLLGEAYAACIKGKWDSSPPVCIKPGCPALTTFLNGEVQGSWRNSLAKFTCNPGYKLIGPSYVYCNGKQWSYPQPYCQAIDIKCDFEKKNTCNWIIDDFDNEDFNWRLQQHEPSSRFLKTGPLHDHTLSPNNTGHYLVLETSDYIPSSKPARIHSPVFPQPSDNSSCFIFWYHMYGNTIGALNVFVNNNLAFQRRGNHGDRWIKGVVSLSENVTRKDLQIIIEGSYGGGYTGDIGLDDFSISSGANCSVSTAKSCVGRCYEAKNDHSSCLCNPECSVDASCCEDFLDVCSIESTTPFFEASTGVEDSTQLYTDSLGTTYYEISFSEMPISSTELGFNADLESITGSSSFASYGDTDSMHTKTDEQFEKTELSSNNDIFYSPSTDANVDEKVIKSRSTLKNISDTELYPLSTTPQESTYSNEETVTENRVSSSLGVINQKNIRTTERTTLSQIKNNITAKSFHNTTTTTTSRYYDQTFTTASRQTTIKSGMDKLTKLFINSSSTTILPQTLSTKTFSFNVSTIIPDNKPGSKDKTGLVPLKMSTGAKAPDVEKSFTTLKKVFVTQSPTTIHSTKLFHTTYIPILTSSSTTKYIVKSFNSSMDKSRLSTMATTKLIAKNFNSSMEKSHPSTMATIKKIIPVQPLPKTTIKNLKSTTPILETSKYNFNITTVLPTLDNVTSLTSSQTKITTVIVDSKKSYSHTHLQTTSRLSPIFNTTEESASFTTLIANTVINKDSSVNNSKKWKSIYKPKDKFMFSAVQRNRDGRNKTFIILSSCAVLIIAISALTVVLFIRRRSRRFVNELEEADTDILYHSSQEMLDLHVARPNH